MTFSYIHLIHKSEFNDLALISIFIVFPFRENYIDLVTIVIPTGLTSHLSVGTRDPQQFLVLLV